MATILVIESSGRKEGSVSRQLVGEFLEQVQAQHPGHTIVRRDLAHDPIPVLSDGVVEAIRTHPDKLTAEQRQQTALSEKLIAELKAADFVVIGAPMYNWSIPAALKAWLDQIMRIGLTFTYGGSGVVGLLGDKPALVVLVRGGAYDSPERAAVDMQKPYLTNVLNVIGLSASFAVMEGSLMSEELAAANMTKARAALKEALARVPA